MCACAFCVPSAATYWWCCRVDGPYVEVILGNPLVSVWPGVGQAGKCGTVGVEKYTVCRYRQILADVWLRKPFSGDSLVLGESNRNTLWMSVFCTCTAVLCQGPRLQQGLMLTGSWVAFAWAQHGFYTSISSIAWMSLCSCQAFPCSGTRARLRNAVVHTA